MHHALLSRTPHRPDAGQPFIGPLRLARGRVHEAHGPARHTLALLLARAMEGPLFWVAPAWTPERLYPPGLANLGVNPGRITFAHARHATDLLWTLEEILRSGAVGLVVGDLPGPPGLTPMRRMQLAAEAGAGAGAGAGAAPIGLILTPEGGAAGAESRWKMSPAHTGDTTAWHLARERARSDPPRSWRVVPDGTGVTLAPDGAGGTAVPDGAGGTAAPDGVGVTAAPDGAGVTAAPDGAGVTAAPDGAGVTAAPDGAGVTAAPDGAGVTAAD